MVQILELFGGIGSPRCALRNIGIPVQAYRKMQSAYQQHGEPERGVGE